VTGALAHAAQSLRSTKLSAMALLIRYCSS
jgi:hypothetical protein